MTYFRILAAVITAACIMMLVPMAEFDASAEGSAALSAPSDITVGSSFDVSFTFTADSDIGWVWTNVIYDENAITYTDGIAVGGNGLLQLQDFPNSGSDALTVTLSFVANKEGRAMISLSNCAVCAPDGSVLSNPAGALELDIGTSDGSDAATSAPTDTPDDSETLSDTTTAVTTVSTVATNEDGYPSKGVLKSLTVSEGELIPAFSPDIFDYVVKVDHSVDYLDIDAQTMSLTDYIWFEGSKWLGDGDTIRTITVTDDEGVEKVYRIVIQRAAAPETSAVNAEAGTADDVAGEMTGAEPPDVSESIVESSADISSLEKQTSGMDDFKKKIMPALFIVLGVLIIALFIMISWLKNRSERKRKKIKQSRKN